MSIASASALPPASITSPTISASGSARRPQPTTVAPRPASSSAVALPMPGARARDHADLAVEQAGGEDARGAGPSSAGAYEQRIVALSDTLERGEGASRRDPARGPAPGRRRGDEASVVVEPMRGGTRDLPAAASSSSEHGGLRGTLAARGIGVSREDYVRLPVPRLPGPAPDRRADPDRHRASTPRSPRTRATTWAASSPAITSSSRARTSPRSCASRGLAPKDIAGRRPHPPPPRPRLGDLGVPRRDVRRQRARVGGGDGVAVDPEGLRARPTTTTPSTSRRSTSTPTSSTRTGPSAARSTCSATGRSGSSSRPATPSATAR